MTYSDSMHAKRRKKILAISVIQIFISSPTTKLRFENYPFTIRSDFDYIGYVDFTVQ